MLRRLMIVLGCLVVLLVTMAGGAFLLRHELMRLYEDLPPFTHSGGEIRETQVGMRDGAKFATI
jgi:uncharacterized protein YneF (UPF0154 family)